MKITFGGVFTALASMEQAARSVGLDYDNAFGDTSQRVLSAEAEAVRQSYMELYNATITTDLDMDSIRKQIDVCMKSMDVF